MENIPGLTHAKEITAKVEQKTIAVCISMANKGIAEVLFYSAGKVKHFANL